MREGLFQRIFVSVFTVGICFISSIGQSTERTPFAIEFPELESGLIVEPRSGISNANVNIVRFWILNPTADSIESSRISVKINHQSANRICAHMSASRGKILRCDLNRFVGFKLKPKENLFEIEASDQNGKRFFATFTTITGGIQQESRKQQTPNGLGFSGRKFAVVLGVSRYKYNDIGLGNLNYADADADALVSWLKNEGGFSPSDILHLTNEYATLSLVRDSLNRFLTKAAETDLVLFFFAGHGTPDPYDPASLYYLVHDSKVADLKNTAFPMMELKNIIDRTLRSKRVIILLDTCHSAGVSGQKVIGFGPSGAGSRNIDREDFDERILERVKVKNDVSSAATRLFGSPGRAVLTSSDVNEASREGKKWGGGHGVFTWAILEGLRGGADTNSDKRITAEELFGFIQTKVRSETGSKQNPRLFTSLEKGLEIAVIK